MTCNFPKLFLSGEKRKSCTSHLEHWNYLLVQRLSLVWKRGGDMKSYLFFELLQQYFPPRCFCWSRWHNLMKFAPMQPCPQVLFAPVTGEDVFGQMKVMPFREASAGTGTVQWISLLLWSALLQSPDVSVLSVSLLFYTAVDLLRLPA